MRAVLSVVCGALLLAACSASGCPRTRSCGGGHAGSAAGPLSDGGSDDTDGGDPTTGSGTGTGAGDAAHASDPGTICTSAGECEQHIAIANASHVAGAIKYSDPPPAGGNHNPCWGEWGVHDMPLPASNWVHNLEHGGVVLLYNCAQDCSAEVGDLSAFVASHPRTVLTQYTDMPARFAVVAWGYRLLMRELDLDAVAEFYLAHFDRGPEATDSPPPTGCWN